MIKTKNLTICKRCILDTTIPEIYFGENGICNYCMIHNLLEKEYPNNKNGKRILKKIIEKIKKSGVGKKYDCIVGVSGGTDSSYTLFLAKKLGLKPLAVHFDNGWNSEIAVENIKKMCNRLHIDLYTYVVDWEEFKNLQISFLKASVPDVEIPTDIGIHATLIKTAVKEGVRYVLNGHSFRAEGISPKGWTYMDGKYISSVHKRFGNIPLKTFPNFTLFDLCYYNLIKGIVVVPLLNYFDYEKIRAKKLLSKKFGWKYYGGHHHENTYTYFVQSYLLPKKFNIDKRKTEFAAMIRSKAMSREKALEIVSKSEYEYDNAILEYAIAKLGLTKKEFNIIYTKKIKSYHDYPTYNPLLMFFKPLIRIAYKNSIIPKVLYYKFFV